MGQFNMGGFADNRKNKKGESSSEESSEEFSFGSFSFFGFDGDTSSFDFKDMPKGANLKSGGGGERPDMSSFNSSSMPVSQFSNSKITTFISYFFYLLLMLALLFGLKFIKRR